MLFSPFAPWNNTVEVRYATPSSYMQLEFVSLCLNGKGTWSSIFKFSQNLGTLLGLGMNLFSSIYHLKFPF